MRTTMTVTHDGLHCELWLENAGWEWQAGIKGHGVGQTVGAKTARDAAETLSRALSASAGLRKCCGSTLAPLLREASRQALDLAPAEVSP